MSCSTCALWLRAGMLDLKGAQEWVVTTKLGSSDVRPGTTPVVTRNCRLYAGEMAMSAFVLAAAFYGVFTVNRWTFSIFLFLQASPCSHPEYMQRRRGFDSMTFITFVNTVV